MALIAVSMDHLVLVLECILNCRIPATVIFYSFSAIRDSGAPLKAKTLPISNSRDPPNASMHTHVLTLKST